MVNIKQKFYDTTYRKEKNDLTPRSSIGWLYMLFRNFEKYRSNVVMELLGNGEKILDIGCGNGELLIKSLNNFKMGYGIDISPTRLQQAKKSVDKKRIKLSVFDADEPFPFTDNFFDAVTLIATLEHFFDPYEVISEVVRILKPGGQVIIQVPNLGFLPRRLDVIMGKLPVTSEDEYGWDGGHLHYFTVSTLIEMLNKFHLKTEKVTCSGVFAPLRDWYVALLGADIIISARRHG